jgi:hypothetical protein
MAKTERLAASKPDDDLSRDFLHELMEEERPGAGGERDGRDRSDEEIPDHAAAQRRRERQHQDTENIEMGEDRSQRALEGEEEGAGQITDADQGGGTIVHDGARGRQLEVAADYR